MRYSEKWPEYAKQWDRMKIDPDRQKQFDNFGKFAVEHKDIYKAIEKKTGVPWYQIAVIHKRESDSDFKTYLGNGEPLNRRTRLVPKGRGPFRSFEEGAVDALQIDGLTDVKDWRLEKLLYYSEIYNGGGYARRGLPSPYIWGGTNIQKPGKYTSDGVFNPRAWDSQPGVAPMLASIAKYDPSVKFTRED